MADVRQGLVAYWPLDSTDGATTPDLSPFSNHLSLVGMSGADFTGLGVRSNAASFDGASKLLGSTNSGDRSTGFPIYDARKYTIMLWVNGVGTAQLDKRVFAEANSTTTTPLLNIGTDSQANAATRTNIVDIHFRDSSNAEPISHRKSTGMAFDGTWHHIAWVDEDGAARLYIDGQLDATSYNYTRTPINLNTMAVGGIQRSTAGAFFLGSIDEVAVWERSLTQGEIQDVMTNGIATPIPVFPLFINLQPASATRGLGDRITLSVVAGGPRPFSYQWYKNSNQIAGATSPDLTLTNLTTADAADYFVDVSNLTDTNRSSTATLTVTTDPAPNVQNGLVSYWPLDVLQTNGLGQISTPDCSGSNDMRLVNMGSGEQAAGVFSNALTFNGIDQYAFRVGGSPIYDNLAFSMAIWIRGNVQTDRRFFSEGATNNNNPLVNFGSDQNGFTGKIKVQFRKNDLFSAMNRQSTGIALDGTWHHVVYTESNGLGKLYIDGALDPTDFTYTRGPVTVHQTSLGAILRASASSFFIGSLDDVGLWNRRLTFTEVQQIYTNGIPVPLRFTDVQLSGGNVVLTFRTPNTAAIHRIDEKTNITDITWAEVPSVTFTNPAGKVLTATFAQPMGGQRFYRARLVP